MGLILDRLIRRKEKILDENEVLKYAQKKHRGQFRKDEKTPYIEHPKMVAEILKEMVMKYGREEDVEVLPMLVAAAYLHDTLEDTYSCPKILEKRFGEVVAGLVQDVTTVNYEKNEKGKDNYLAEKMVAMSDYALVLKLADRLGNICDSACLSLDEKFRLRRGTEYILKYVEDERSQYFSVLQASLIDELWEALDKYIPYKIFVGTKYDDLVFNNTTYVHPNFHSWHESFTFKDTQNKL